MRIIPRSIKLTVETTFVYVLKISTDARTHMHAFSHARAHTFTHTEICNTYCFLQQQ